MLRKKIEVAVFFLLHTMISARICHAHQKKYIRILVWLCVCVCRVFDSAHTQTSRQYIGNWVTLNASHWQAVNVINRSDIQNRVYVCHVSECVRVPRDVRTHRAHSFKLRWHFDCVNEWCDGLVWNFCRNFDLKKTIPFFQRESNILDNKTKLCNLAIIYSRIKIERTTPLNVLTLHCVYTGAQRIECKQSGAVETDLRWPYQWDSL